MRCKTKTLFLFFLFVCLPPFAQAQSSGSGGDDISAYLGSMLPNQIDGVRDILPVFGARYGLGLSAGGALEFGFTNSHARGVDFTTAEISLRGEIPAGDGLTGLVYAGADFNWYIPEGDSSRKTDTGLHVGIGAMAMVSDSVWLRGDLKFMGGPGTSLCMLFGIVFRNSGTR